MSSTSRSSAVCPGLIRREDGTFICQYTGRPVNPYALSCFLDYITCPIYIRHRVEAKTAEKPSARPEEAATEQKPEVAVTLPAETRPPPPPREFEELVVEDLERLLSSYESKVQELDRKWSEYEQSVNATRAEFDKERVIIEHHLELLKRTIAMYEFDLKELEYRRELGIISEEQYNKLREDLVNKLDKLKRQFEEFTRRFENVLSGVLTHVRRVLTLVPSPEVGKIRLVLARLDELLRDGKITHEVYDKLKRELESIVSGV